MNLIKPTKVNNESTKNLTKGGKACYERKTRKEKSKENKRITSALRKALSPEVWPESSKKAAVIASRYLNSVGKGENALELSSILQENYSKKGTPEFQEFHVPEYIKNAIEWVCDDK